MPTKNPFKNPAVVAHERAFGNAIPRPVPTVTMYDGRSKLTQTQIAELWIIAGGDAQKADLMSAIAMAESSGIVHNGNHCCKGLYAFNTEVGVTTNKCAFSPSCATKKAISLSQNGTNLTPWEAYTNGHYKRFIGKSGVGEHGGFQFPFGSKAEKERIEKIAGEENLKSGFEIGGFNIGDIVGFVARLFEPSFWLRVGKGIAGFLLLLYGALTLMKVLVGIEVPVAKPTRYLRGQIAAAAGKSL